MKYQIEYKITSVFITQVDADSEKEAVEKFRTMDMRSEVEDNIHDGGIHHDEISIENIREE